MKLKSLLNKQEIDIEDHRKGSGEIKNWADPSADIHIHKTTKYKIEGKSQDVTIKISINNFRPIVSLNVKKRDVPIPEKLRREILNAFKNEKKVSEFVSDLVKILKDYEPIFQSREKVIQSLKILSMHFDLLWNEQLIIKMVDEAVKSYTGIYTDKSEKEFFITFEEHNIRLGDIDEGNRNSFNV
ncbi:MAG: hypothetical protein WCJ61_05800 [Paludibacter sp.]